MSDGMQYAPFDPKGFPGISGVYAIFRNQECLYVGRSRNMRQRWKDHHRLPDLERIDDHLTMGWLFAPEKTLQELETRMIRQLQPQMNRRAVSREFDIMRLARVDSRVYLAVLALQMNAATARYQGDCWIFTIMSTFWQGGEGVPIITPMLA